MLFSSLRKRSNQKVRWFLIATFPAIMMLWVNLHSGFAFGFLLLIYFNVEALVVGFMARVTRARFDLTAPLALAASVGATLLNPYGTKLITYVIGMFSSPSKAYITEMLPIDPQNLANPELWPFLVFLGLCIADIVYVLSENEKFEELTTEQKIHRFFTIGLMALTTFMAFSSRRFISICVLTIVFQIIALNSQKLTRRGQSAGEEATGEISHEQVSSTADCLRRILFKSQVAPALLVAVSIAVTGILAAQQTLMLPQKSHFIPPFKAMHYLKENLPPGNVYNDPHFGSMLIWYRPESPKVFIDTRFDIYESAFLKDFGEALFGNGYKELFDRYQVSWVFLKPVSPLVEILSRDPDWQTCYRDDCSVIMKLKKR
jgi:hypothetical protein